MTDLFKIHPVNPQARLIRRVVEIIRAGGVIAYPTDSAYALGCQLGNKDAMEVIRCIRQLDKQHNFTLMCHDLSEIALYARVDNAVFRFLKGHTPGPFTFILEASREVPRRLQHAKRKTIGLRIPDHLMVSQLLAELGEPLLSVSLILPNEKHPLINAEEIYERLSGRIDLVIDAGHCGLELTTIVDLTGGKIEILRQGKGEV